MNIDAATLVAAVRTVLPAARNGHLPVLKGVHLCTFSNEEHSRLAVTATDLDLTIRTHFEATGLVNAVVPGALLAAWLEGRDGEVTLTDDDDNGDLVLGSDTGTMRLRTLPLEDFPRVEMADGDPAPLERRIATILYAASRDTARPILNGVGIGGGWAACTDSYQLAAMRLEGPPAILPVRVLELALKTEGEATITADDRRVTIDVGATSYTGRLIEGTFPTWQPLVGKAATMVTLDRDATIAALERVCVLAEAETPVRVKPGGDGLTFTVVSRDVGEIVEHVAGGDEMGGEYGFRPRLLINLLRSRDEAKVEVGVTDQIKPVSVGGLDQESVALVMPVRLS